MSLATQLCGSLVVSIVLAYPIRRRASVTMQQGFVAAMWAVVLSVPLMHAVPLQSGGNDDSLPRNSFVTMAVASVAFMVPLKVTQAILFPKAENDDTTSFQNKNTTAKHPLSVGDFLWFTADILYYLMPVSQVKPSITWKDFGVKSIEFLVWIPFKMVLTAAFQTTMVQLSEQEAMVTGGAKPPGLYSKLLLLFCGLLLASSWQQDIQALLMHVVTLGNYEMLPFHNYVLLRSLSLKDFWGKRYNRLISHLLLHTVYIPAQNYGHYTKRQARYMSFFVSGMMHVYIVHLCWGTGYIRSLVFFVLQPVWMDIESHLVLPVGRTHFVFLLSSVLYVGLFVEAMPEWFGQNPAVLTHPVVDEQWAPAAAERLVTLLSR